MSAGEQFAKCSRCNSLLQDYVCRKCRLVHCPFCGRPEKGDQCPHLLADWAGIGGQSSHIYHSPFLEGTLPFLDVEFDSPMILLPIDSKTALGDLSHLLQAYGENVFQPPSRGHLLELMAKMITIPCACVSRSEPGMAGMGGHVFWFASDAPTARAEITSILFRLRERMTELEQRLHAQIIEEQLRAPVPQAAFEEVVYGEVADNLVFAKKCDAEKLAGYRKALKTSKTWGEFRSHLSPEDYNLLIEYWEPPDFAEFYEDLLRNDPNATPEQARAEYLELPVGNRPPEEDDPFDQGSVPWAEDGDWPELPAQQMLYWIPQEIQKEYGTVESTYLNGEYLTFSPGDEGVIVATFRRLGYRCIRDDALIQRASGYEV